MKSYQYQVLRFMPDAVTGEFANVGLILYSKEERFVKMDTITKVGRLASFFEGISCRPVLSTVKHLKHIFDSHFAKSLDGLDYDFPEKIKDLTSRYLSIDNNALSFSDVLTGVDLHLEGAFDDLFFRLVLQYTEESVDPEIRSDNEVWQKVYKREFDKLGITHQLMPHVVKGEMDAIQFDYSWKNSVWHCYEPISFNLVHEDNIRDKVYKWVGKISELQSSDEKVMIHLLGYLPEKPDLKNFILQKLDEKSQGNVEVSLVKQDDAEHFALQLKMEMENH